MYKYTIKYLLLAVLGFTLPVLGMDVPRARFDPVIARMKQNEAAEGKRKRFGYQPNYVRLMVEQPTAKLQRVEDFIKTNAQQIGQSGYTTNPMGSRYLRLMTFYVPLDEFPGDREFLRMYAESALNTLATIVQSHIAELNGVNFEYTRFDTLGQADQHLIALHKFASPNDEAKFYTAYNQIVQEFLKAYPTSWMTLPYALNPHVNVAQRKGKLDELKKRRFQPLNVPNWGERAFKNTITLGYRKKGTQPEAMIVRADESGLNEKQVQYP